MPHPDEQRDLIKQEAIESKRQAEEAEARRAELGEDEHYTGGAAPSAVPNHPKDPLIPTMRGTLAFPQPQSEREQQEQTQQHMERDDSGPAEVPDHILSRNEAGRPVKGGKANPEGTKDEPDAKDLSKKDAEHKK